MAKRGGRRPKRDLTDLEREALSTFVSRNQRHIERGIRNSPRYGITAAEWTEMFLAQDKRCAICKRRYDMLVIDHDHETGEVRGLLCPGCNQALGFFRDDPKRLAAAIVYLRRPPASWEVGNPN